MEKMTVSQAKKAISDKLSHFFGVDTKTATDAQYYKAVALIVRDRLSQMNSDFRQEAKGQDSKEIYYLFENIGISVLDGTCPFVKKIHKLVYAANENGDHIIIVGNSLWAAHLKIIFTILI